MIRNFTTALRGTLTNNSLAGEIGPLDGAASLMKVSGYFGQKAITRKTIVILESRDGGAISGQIHKTTTTLRNSRNCQGTGESGPRLPFCVSTMIVPNSNRWNGAGVYQLLPDRRPTSAAQSAGVVGLRQSLIRCMLLEFL